MKSNTIKRILFAFVLLFVVLLFVQQQFDFVKPEPLKGAITHTEKPKLSFQNWFDNSFQTEFQKYINEQFGFRTFFVRLNNQISFNLFNKAKANGVVIGKENYLYESNYIKAYYGTDSISDSLIDSRLLKIKFLQDTLKKLNIDLVLIYAPGKGSYLPEFIPENLKPLKTFRTNYSRCIRTSNNLGIRYIDFHDYFSKIKSQTPYPLYPKYGIHWSSYGRDIVFDSIVHYVEKTRKIDLINITLSLPVLTTDLRETDYDIGDGMNLFSTFKSFPMAYSDYFYETNSSKPKPKILAIADSYWWTVYGISRNIFSNSKFWFYNNQAYSDDPDTEVSKLNLKMEIENSDIIIIMATDATLPKLGWGFIENVYKLYSKRID